jgi:hypothetical protein
MLSTPLLIRQYLYFCVQSVRTRDSPTYYPKFIFGGFSSFPFVHFFRDDSLSSSSEEEEEGRRMRCRRDVLWLCDALPFDRWDHWREGGRRRRRMRGVDGMVAWRQLAWGGKEEGGPSLSLFLSLARTRSHPAGVGWGGGGGRPGLLMSLVMVKTRTRRRVNCHPAKLNPLSPPLPHPLSQSPCF